MVPEREADVVGGVEIEVAVAVGIEEGGPCADLLSIGHVGAFRGIDERAVAEVAEQSLGPKRGEEEIDKAVLVDIPGDDPEAVVAAVDAGGEADVAKHPRAEIPAEGMPGGRLGVSGLGSRKECPVGEIEIDPAIAVVVERGDAGRQRLDKIPPTAAPVGVDKADAGSLRGVDEPDRRGGGWWRWLGGDRRDRWRGRSPIGNGGRPRRRCRWSRLATAEDQNEDNEA